MKLFKRKALGTGHQGGIKKRLEDKLPEPKIELCKHNDYCNVRRINGWNCFANDEPRTCQTYRFYERYGIDWEQMGVGS